MLGAEFSQGELRLVSAGIWSAHRAF